MCGTTASNTTEPPDRTSPGRFGSRPERPRSPSNMVPPAQRATDLPNVEQIRQHAARERCHTGSLVRSSTNGNWNHGTCGPRNARNQETCRTTEPAEPWPEEPRNVQNHATCGTKKPADHATSGTTERPEPRSVRNHGTARSHQLETFRRERAGALGRNRAGGSLLCAADTGHEALHVGVDTNIAGA